MDLDGLSLSDRRNRFQVNRVDSVATGHHSPSHIDGPSLPAATLVSYKERSNVKNSMSMTDGCESRAARRVSIANNDGSGNGEPIGAARRLSQSQSSSPSKLISSSHASSTEYHSHFNQNSTVTNTNPYDTRYAKSFRHFTREALPRLDNYRNMMSIQAAYRPTLDELHDITLHQEKSTDATPVANLAVEGGFVKFGWIKGVFVRCLLNIWGVMLFLRLSWVVGQAGVVEAFIIIFLATSVTCLTGISMSAISTNGQIKGAQAFLIILSMTLVTLISALSMAAVCTNGLVKGGGTYYMISRSLGPEFGASIGLIFALANAIAVAMYTVGFAESMVDLLKSLDTYVVQDDTNSIRIIGTVAIVVQTCIVVIGMEWEATAQVGLLFILLAAMADFVIGSIIGPLSTDELSKGFVGFNGTLFLDNLGASYRFSEGVDQTFFSVFSIFFPAATGILAGANISGDLADPQYSIPKGTLLAILVTTVSYLAFAAIAGACVLRDATGPTPGIENYTDLEAWNVTLQTFQNCYSYNETTGQTDYTCRKWGLMNNFQVMELVSAWGPLIYAGCFAATLSSALASLVSAPKVFQALCNDKLYPYLEFFGKGYGKNNEPVRGYVLTFIIALAFILIAQLNAIAPLISNFFLAAYALVNFSTFHASLAKPVGWRPTFRYYNMWLSLVGAILCVAVMFLISWITALLTFGAIICLYLIVIYRKPDVNWGSTTQAQTYKNALMSVQQLNNVDDHVKNFRPQILILSGLPFVRPSLVDFAYLVTKQLSLMVCGQVIKSNLNNRMRTSLSQKAQNWFQTQNMKAFFCVVDDMDFEDGARALLQAYGVGKLRPNILLMGYKHDWMMCRRSDLVQYFSVIHKALDMHISVAVLRIEGGLDFSKKISFGGNEDQTLHTPVNRSGLSKSKSSSNESLPRNPSDLSFSQGSHGNVPSSVEETENKTPKAVESKSLNRSSSPVGYKSVDGGEVSRDVMDDLLRFQRKYKHGTVDVWWLYDDGGLTLLLPYIITTRSSWSSCKLRVFTLANKKDEFDSEQRSMAELLSKFRIDYSDLRVIPDINAKPQAATVEFFEKHISSFRRSDAQKDNENDVCVTDAEILSMRDKTNRHMRLRELLLQHSRNSSLVVMTLPMPRKGVVSAPLYMTWLELLTKDMPPFLLVRGNQTSVLTFYS